MKKLFLTTIIGFFLFGCSNNRDVILKEENKTELQAKASKNEENEPLLRKLSRTFNKLVQKKDVYEHFKDVASESSKYKGYYIFNAETIRDMIIKGQSFNELFAELYKDLYNSSLDYSQMLSSLPKLHFGVPYQAFENYDEWKETAFPIIAKSYDIKDSSLLPILRSDVIKTIGNENFKKLTSLHEGKKFYLSKSKEFISIISGTNTEGAIVKVANDKDSDFAEFATFKINNKVHYNSISLKTDKEEFSFVQDNMFQQTYIDVFTPNVCNGYYVFDCNSIEYQNYVSEKQKIADETCETYGTCLPLCCNGSIIWAMIEFRPNSLKCARAMDYVSNISMYSLTALK